MDIMDGWLDSVGMYRKNTALDGTCLFRAVAEQLLPANPCNGHLILRKQCCNFMLQNRELYQSKICVEFEEYMSALSVAKGWGTVLELDAISRMYQVDFLVYFGPGDPIDVTKNEFDKTLRLCVTNESFYDAVYKKDYIQTLGFCQSIIYDILYSQVFKMKNIDYAVKRMLHDKAAKEQREKYLHELGYGRDNINKLPYDPIIEEHVENVDVKKVLDSGAILFPYKVAKALDPDIYRNIDFDSWLESQRGKPLPEQVLFILQVTRRSNIWNNNSGTLRVGCMCYVKWDGKVMKAHIHELAADRSSAMVFIEELSQKRSVPFDDLLPYPRSPGRPEWSYSQKRQMINRFTNRNSDNSPEIRSSSKLRGRRGQRTDSSNNDQTDLVSHANNDMDTSGSPSNISKVLINTPLGSWDVVNRAAQMSINEDFSDLPLDDLQTLRYFYNMGIVYFQQGHYVPEMNGCVSPGDSHLAQVCQGVPLIQPPPPTPLSVVPITPPIFVDPNFTIGPITAAVPQPPPPQPSATYPTVVNVCHTAPEVTSSTIPISNSINREISSNFREGKERRGSKFTKPPRFQRLEMAKNAQQRSVGNTTDIIQVEEISSSTHPETYENISVTIVPSYIEPEIQMAEPIAMEVSYGEISPYQDYTTIEAPSSSYFEHDGNYSSYFVYPCIAPYQ